MLKALFMLDCDECHEPLTQAAAVSEQDEDLMTYTWQEAVDTLMCWASVDGWEFHNQVHICPGCLPENQELSRNHDGGIVFL